MMGISERYECYIFGQCQVRLHFNNIISIVLISEMQISLQEYSVNMQMSVDAESCHKTCTKNYDCEWWTWLPTQSLCILFHNCTESGYPDARLCPDCISGQRMYALKGPPQLCLLRSIPNSCLYHRCPPRECHIPIKCKANFLNSYRLHHLEDCIKVCNDNPLCKWYTHEKTHDHCILYQEDCAQALECTTCATGKRYCSNGYLPRSGPHGKSTRSMSDDIPWPGDFVGNPVKKDLTYVAVVKYEVQGEDKWSYIVN